MYDFIYFEINGYTKQSYKSGGAFWVGFGFEPKFKKNFGPNLGPVLSLKTNDRLFRSKCFRPNLTFGLFRASLQLRIKFGFGSELVGSFTTLTQRTVQACNLKKNISVSQDSANRRKIFTLINTFTCLF